MSDLQTTSGRDNSGSEDKYSSPHSMGAMIADLGDKLEAVIHVDVEEVDITYAVVWKDNERRLTVPGYRPGKAPRKRLETLHGKKVQEVVTGILVQRFYEKALRKLPFEISTRPELFYDEPAIRGKHFKFSFTVPKPDSEISEMREGSEEREALPAGVVDVQADDLTDDDGDGDVDWRILDSFVNGYLDSIILPDYKSIKLKRFLVDIRDQEVGEYIERLLSNEKSEEELVRKLGLSSVSELPGYARTALLDKYHETATELMRNEVCSVIMEKSHVTIGGKRVSVKDDVDNFTGVITLEDGSKELSEEEYGIMAMLAIFAKIAKTEGLPADMSKIEQGADGPYKWGVGVMDWIIKQATIEEVRFEDWAKDEKLLGRSVD